MLYTKFRGNRSTVTGEETLSWVYTIYGQCFHFGHVTSIMLINFHFCVPKSLHTKFGKNSPADSEKKASFNFICNQGQEMTLTLNTHISSLNK